MFHGIISVSVFVFVVIIYGEIRKWLIKRKLRNFESPKDWPILGVIPQFFGKFDEQFFKVLLDLFNEVKATPFQMWLGPVLMIGVSEPEDIKILLTSDDCLNRPYLYKFFMSTTTIASLNKEKWKPHRRALNAAFNPKVLRNFVSIVDKKSRNLGSKMEPLKESLDIYELILMLHMDIISTTLLGTDLFDEFYEEAESLKEMAKVAMNSVQCRYSRIWYHLDWIFNWSTPGREQRDCMKKGNEIFESMYARRLEEIRKHGFDYLNKINEKNTAIPIEKFITLERDGNFTHKTVMEYMQFFLMAGIETSSIVVYSTALMLSINPHHQDLAVEELRSILDSADCDITYDHLIQMTYLERVIKETMRLLPPVTFFARTPSSDIKVSRGIIPKDAIVLINVMHLHRDPKIWGENALEFDPDRFLPENIAKRPPFSYLPFSGGSRNCIAMKYAMMSAKIVLANILRQYKATTKLKFEDIQLKPKFVLEIANENAFQKEERIF